MAARKLLLPSQRSLLGLQGQGWQFPTRVGASRVPEAGNGRYALQSMPKHSVLVVKPFAAMSKIDCLLSVPADRTITFENAGDIEKYIELNKTQGGFSREVVLEELSNFVYGFDKKHACLNASTWTINHADETEDSLNVIFHNRTLPDGTLARVGEAQVDVNVGDELNNNYRKFVIPDFYLDFCQKNGIRDVRTIVMEAVDGVASSTSEPGLAAIISVDDKRTFLTMQ